MKDLNLMTIDFGAPNGFWDNVRDGRTLLPFISNEGARALDALASALFPCYCNARDMTPEQMESEKASWWQFPAIVLFAEKVLHDKTHCFWHTLGSSITLRLGVEEKREVLTEAPTILRRRLTILLASCYGTLTFHNYCPTNGHCERVPGGMPVEVRLFGDSVLPFLLERRTNKNPTGELHQYGLGDVLALDPHCSCIVLN